MNFCSFTTDMTDAELHECIHKMRPRVTESKTGFLLTISNYDDDPRDLWEIPEAVAFCKRLIDIGMGSMLDLSSAMYAQKLGLPAVGFGLIEVMYMAEGRIKKRGSYDISVEDVNRAAKLYEESNIKVEAILAKPCPNTGIREMEHFVGRASEVSDGAHRHKRKT